MSRKWSGQVAKEARIRAGFERPGDAAERIGVHFATVYAWESGRQVPLVTYASALADLYGIPMETFFVEPNGKGSKA